MKIHKTPLTAAHCADCGDALYDGDTGYSLHGMTFCPACVSAALTVCHPPHDAAQYMPHFDSKLTERDGIPHREIIPKTGVKHAKTTANSRIQKG